MKKTILALSLSVLSVLGFSAMAQNQKCEGKKCENKEVCKKECKKDGKDCKKFDRAQYNPFDGLNLTEAQTQQLAALKSEMKQNDGQRSDKKEQMTPEQRQEKMKEMMQKRENRSREYLAKVKSILTPEQYVSFLENVAVHKSHHKMMARKNGHRPDMKRKK